MDRDTSRDDQRDESEWNRNQFSAWDSEEGALRAARSEARESLTETIDSIRRIDQSAMRTLRIDLVILGLSVTAASSFQFPTKFLNGLTILGFVGVMLSAVVAVVATSGSERPTGVSEAYLSEFQQASWTEREWNEWMLQEYSRWLAEANQIADGDARALLYAQLCLGVGLIALVSGVTLGVTGLLDSVV
ncbi:hypothetical protein [Halorussus ruber]|uniref:hypothetical protein n=1 Tax=Halorussus ruber TaxID=1126238 RepID=UPI0010920074|nr:hypothetical protein [Halorussus ruber]